ncbi:glycoprotein-N-acetylgalactosamine 3-beta-galactosyltransferase 1-like [Penaeus indicus]|uniref:glycoprotein-N-acetylgalactosamine 3-beta-galactosyltransferase 1-like n=1 Tax=Penaeus indicus TaxID=29960 RepID=UPI00300C46D2
MSPHVRMMSHVQSEDDTTDLTDPSVGAVDVGSREGYTKLWNKTRSALKYIYENHLHDFEWFLKADSDTYVLVDNLRYVLQDYDTNDPLYFGQHYKIYGGYNTGGNLRKGSSGNSPLPLGVSDSPNIF